MCSTKKRNYVMEGHPSYLNLFSIVVDADSGELNCWKAGKS